ncbi:leucine-rich repeat-containing protein 3B isoform X3 [Pogoniulus pusillus]|uniref:leucine-rich repeat-containing protein 3B isoform X3 n=1 Tax=Pogoniulus pusillus TaxID=488313 RepID=UPI0030B95431
MARRLRSRSCCAACCAASVLAEPRCRGRHTAKFCGKAAHCDGLNKRSLTASLTEVSSISIKHDNLDFKKYTAYQEQSVVGKM